MIKLFLGRLPMSWKFILVGFLILFGSVSSMVWFLDQVTVVLDMDYRVAIEPLLVFKKDLIRLFSVVFLIGIVLLWLLYRDITSYLNAINHNLATTVAKRRLSTHFDEINTGDVFSDIVENANILFSLFKNYDTMKSARISLEVNSIKQLINIVDEGVVLIKKDKVVSHINHRAEEILKLIPGQIVGQIVARHISHQDILASIDDALMNDQRINDMEIDLRIKDSKVFMSVLPIKNKFGDVVRVLIVLNQSAIVPKDALTDSSEPS